MKIQSWIEEVLTLRDSPNPNARKCYKLWLHDRRDTLDIDSLKATSRNTEEPCENVARGSPLMNRTWLFPWLSLIWVGFLGVRFEVRGKTPPPLSRGIFQWRIYPTTHQWRNKKWKIKGIESIPWWNRHNKSRRQAEVGKDSIWMETSDYLASQTYYYTDSQKIPQSRTSRTWVYLVDH